MGMEDFLSSGNERLDAQLKFTAEMTTDEIVDTAKRFFYEHYGLYGEGKIRLKYRLPRFGRMSVDSFLQRGRVVIHDKEYLNGHVSLWNGDYSLSTKMNESELRGFIETKFGKSIYPAEQTSHFKAQHQDHELHSSAYAARDHPGQYRHCCAVTRMAGRKA